MKTIYIVRANTNQKVFDNTNAPFNTKHPPEKNIKPSSCYIHSKQESLLKHIFRSANEDPLRQATLTFNSPILFTPTSRRVGPGPTGPGKPTNACTSNITMVTKMLGKPALQMLSVVWNKTLETVSSNVYLTYLSMMRMPISSINDKKRRPIRLPITVRGSTLSCEHSIFTLSSVPPCMCIHLLHIYSVGLFILLYWVMYHILHTYLLHLLRVMDLIEQPWKRPDRLTLQLRPPQKKWLSFSESWALTATPVALQTRFVDLLRV